MSAEKEAMDSLLNELKEIKSNVLASNQAVHGKLDTIQNSLMPMNEKLQDHSKSITYLHNDSRRKNLVFFGLQEKPSETLPQLIESILALINNKMNVHNLAFQEIDFCKRIGTFSTSTTSTRPVLLKLVSQLRKSQILQNAKLLKGLSIRVQPDYSPEMREHRKQLVVEMQELRRAGKHAVIKQNKVLVLGDMNRRTTSGTKRASSESPSEILHKKPCSNNMPPASHLSSSSNSLFDCSFDSDQTVIDNQDLNRNSMDSAGTSVLGMHVPNSMNPNVSLTQTAISQYFQPDPIVTKNQ